MTATTLSHADAERIRESREHLDALSQDTRRSAIERYTDAERAFELELVLRSAGQWECDYGCRGGLVEVEGGRRVPCEPGCVRVAEMEREEVY